MVSNTILGSPLKSGRLSSENLEVSNENQGITDENRQVSNENQGVTDENRQVSNEKYLGFPMKRSQRLI